jgi:Flp pilus assembly protein TadG
MNRGGPLHEGPAEFYRVSATSTNREERTAVKRHQERTSDERGQTLVEFAALLPVLCLLLFGIIQFGVTFHDYLTVTDASRVGARKAAVSRFVGDSGAAAEAAALNAANGLDEDDVTASCEADDWDTAGSDVSCTVTYPYSIEVLGLPVVTGTLTSVTTERLE